MTQCFCVVPVRFEELKPDEQERMENKGWLMDHLTGVAAFCYGDLKAMKDTGHQCFPPTYDIVKFFISHYHDCLVNVVRKIIIITNVSDSTNLKCIYLGLQRAT